MTKSNMVLALLGISLLLVLALTLLAIVVPNWLVQQLKELLAWF